MTEDALLDQIRKIVREENEPLKQDIAILKDGQGQTNREIAQLHTIAEAVKAGQEDVREGNIRIEQKIDRVAKELQSHKKRIDNLEEHTGAENPLKH